ncbi:UNKNOWN [Stylonychia lemnae]|uniref:Uncharacterized protein n=1 Tax=Stylonychia lemnae TaxID=5949 RepID=A0A078A0L3_STYLE|nr:UNKNOWN [Stylonychia lemnae]|eukprot:CDW74998.1 UNKNOWN [Stylonychia lemnae]
MSKKQKMQISPLINHAISMSNLNVKINKMTQITKANKLKKMKQPKYEKNALVDKNQFQQKEEKKNIDSSKEIQEINKDNQNQKKGFGHLGILNLQVDHLLDMIL